ncbi:MAG: HlyD family efflux transporter periplasmic adaptor subunit [Chloroflexi bacterium]|nr:HlyD family efflux transporter periplasmic adaptor subunit [Chloroflexota bacterium]
MGKLSVLHALKLLPRSVRWAALPVAALLVVVVALRVGSAPAPSQPPAQALEVAPRLEARGQVRLASQARVGTLVGGVVARLAVQVGDTVEAQQEIARVRGLEGVEVLTAPWRGTITGVPVHVGDTVTPGTVVATVGDLSRLQVETSDVDEFLITHVRQGQAVRLRVDALDRRELPGRVRTVAPQPQTTPAGDEHYPVVIDLEGAPRELRPGMTVRVNFAE